MPLIIKNGFQFSDNPISIELPLSKSILIRHLVLQFLDRQPLTIPERNAPQDTHITYQALSTIYKYLENKTESFIPIDVGDCGTAYRFLMAALSITDGHWKLTGSKRLLQRPISSLVTTLQKIGAHITPTTNGWHIIGQPLHAKNISIDSSDSSQYISALMLIAKHIGNPPIFQSQHIQPSMPYVNMTKQLIRQYGQCHSTSLERDWSAAAFWYALCAVENTPAILLKGLSTNSFQGDSIIAKWFADFGVYTTETEEGILIQKNGKTLQYDYSLNIIDHPDLAPVLASMACLLPIKLTLLGLKNLNGKESERKNLLYHYLKTVATLSEPDENTLIIQGETHRKKREILQFNSHSDHRLVMAFTLLATRYHIAINDTSCVNKSYPQFSQELQKVIN